MMIPRRWMSNQIPPHLAGVELQPQLQGLPERPDVKQKQLTVCLSGKVYELMQQM